MEDCNNVKLALPILRIEGNCCNNERIECNINRRIIGLDLQRTPLSSIPAELVKLTELESLNLSGNLLEQPSFSFLRYLQKLKVLILSANRFNLVEIPDWIRTLTNLEVLDLSSNSFVAPVSGKFVGLNKLKSLDLSSNSFDTMMIDPQSLPPTIEYVNLDGNMFHGKVPDFSSLPLLQNLRTFDSKYVCIVYPQKKENECPLRSPLPDPSNFPTLPSPSPFPPSIPSVPSQNPQPTQPATALPAGLSVVLPSMSSNDSGPTRNFQIPASSPVTDVPNATFGIEATPGMTVPNVDQASSSSGGSSGNTLSPYSTALISITVVAAVVFLTVGFSVYFVRKYKQGRVPTPTPVEPPLPRPPQDQESAPHMAPVNSILSAPPALTSLSGSLRRPTPFTPPRTLERKTGTLQRQMGQLSTPSPMNSSNYDNSPAFTLSPATLPSGSSFAPSRPQLVNSIALSASSVDSEDEIGSPIPNFMTWGLSDVESWLLTSMAASRDILDAFMFHGITGKDLFTITDARLVEMGVEPEIMRGYILKGRDELVRRHF
ncbi:hypothetical protein HDU97_009559 [Phlyctochytrium planicorne]|nr:hypothetical protein HDU97_009559 [Phlyctochytrium planicorne]